VDYGWDDEIPMAERIHKLVAFAEYKCTNRDCGRRYLESTLPADMICRQRLPVIVEGVIKGTRECGGSIIYSPCPYHKTLDEVSRYAAIIDENTMKSGAYGTLLSAIANVPEQAMVARLRQETDACIGNILGISLDEAEKIPEAQPQITLARRLAEFKLGLGRAECKWEFDGNRILEITLPDRVTGAQKGRAQSNAAARFGNKIRVI